MPLPPPPQTDFGVALQAALLRKTSWCSEHRCSLSPASIVFDQECVPWIYPDHDDVLRLVRRVLSEMPQDQAVVLVLRFVDSDAQPFLQQPCFIEVLLNPFKLIKQRFTEFQIVFRELSRSSCAPVGSCTFMNCYALPQVQVVIESVLCNHCTTVSKAMQPVWQQAFS